MSTFVLVHGGFHGGWCYQRVARRLRAAGHEVHTPTLTGLGERSHLAHWPIDLDTHIDDIANLVLWEDLEDIVLLGHSYGGMVITGVADRMPERIAMLVYLDAFLPENGDSVLSLHPSPDEFLRQGAKNGGRSIEARAAKGFGVNANDLAWVDSKLTAHPLATFIQAIRLSGRHLEVPRRGYIYPAGGPAAASYERKRGEAGADVHAIDATGHDMMIDQPDKLFHVLIQFLGGSEDCPDQFRS